ncbi:ATP-binding protein [Candidatus Microgenomates bacterium]|nr:ATP-binding protein [Candidatus Microgenomates bacterium]
MLRSIRIKNFKSLKDVRFEIPDFAVLVGYNGSGKTNFVNALHLISLLAKSEKIEDALLSLSLLSRELLYNPDDNKIEFSFDLVINGSPINYSFTIERIHKEGRIGYEITHEELLNGTKDKPILQRTQKQIRFGVENENPQEIQLVANQLALSLIEKPQIIQETKNILSSITISELGSEYLRRWGVSSNLESNIPRTLAESLFDLKQKKLGVFEEFLKESKRIIPDLMDIEIEQVKDNRLMLRFKEKVDGGRVFTSFSASDGNLRTLAILNSLFSEPRPSVLVIDEVENSFHPARIQALLKVMSYIASIEAGKLQIIVTTHSPVVLNYVNSDEIVYVFKKDGATEIVNPYKNKSVKKHLEMSAEGGTKLGELFSNGLLEEIFTSGN